MTFSSASDAAKRALAETTQQNPVLKKAGVVDAGGAGYVIILDTMLAYMRGEKITRTVVEDTPSDANPFDAFETEDINFTYCNRIYH